MVAVVEVICVARHHSLLEATAGVCSPSDRPRPHPNRHLTLHGAVIGACRHGAHVGHLRGVERPEDLVLIVPSPARPASLLAHPSVAILDVVMRCDLLLLSSQVEWRLKHIRHVDVGGLGRAHVLVQHARRLLVVWNVLVLYLTTR